MSSRRRIAWVGPLSLAAVAVAFTLWVTLVDDVRGSTKSTVTSSSPDASGRPTLRVLFIGNSLTQANDLPGMVEAISRTVEGSPIVEAEMLAVGGADLGDHWQRGASGRIAEGDWDFVVLQQGPSAMPESRTALLEYARTYGPAIRAAGAEPAFYMVWPSDARRGDFPRVSGSYRLAAEEINAVLLPAGDAWRAAWRLDESLPLYGPDAFHPSPMGTYLAALVVYAGLTNRSPARLPLASNADADAPALRQVACTAAQARLLHDAASEIFELAGQPTSRATTRLSP